MGKPHWITNLGLSRFFRRSDLKIPIVAFLMMLSVVSSNILTSEIKMQHTKSLAWHWIWHWSKNAAFIISFQWQICSFAASFSAFLPKTADFYHEKLVQLRFLAVAVCVTLWQSITSSSNLHSCEHSMTLHTDLCSLNETPSVAPPPHIPVGFCHSARFGLNKALAILAW